jgi:hypothetical protein
MGWLANAWRSWVHSSNTGTEVGPNDPQLRLVECRSSRMWERANSQLIVFMTTMVAHDVQEKKPKEWKNGTCIRL